MREISVCLDLVIVVVFFFWIFSSGCLNINIEWVLVSEVIVYSNKLFVS